MNPLIDKIKDKILITDNEKIKRFHNFIYSANLDIDYYDGPLSLICDEGDGKFWWAICTERDSGKIGRKALNRKFSNLIWLCSPITKEIRDQFLLGKIDYRTMTFGCQEEVYIFNDYQSWREGSPIVWKKSKQELIKIKVTDIPEEWLTKEGCYYETGDS